MNDIKIPINHYKNNKLEQIECFFLVATYGTISESTKHTFYSSSTISMQINSFEYDLQIKLFDKTNKKWILTKKGEQIYKIVNNIMTTFKQLYDTKKTQIKALPDQNYKKNKIDQMEGFCTVIEHGSIANAEKFGFSKTTLSKQINSLEYDLQTLFFERTIDGLQTNYNGFKTYIKIKKLLNKIYKLYGKPQTKIKNIFYLIFKQKFKNKKKQLTKKINNIKLKLCLKKMIILSIIFVIFTATSVGFYLNYTNYFFDKKIEKIANPLLKKLIKNGYYRVSSDIKCNFDSTQITVDMYDLLLKLINDKQYQHIHSSTFLMTNQGIISMRFAGDDKIDNIFNDPKVMMCNTEKNYYAMKKMFQDAIFLFKNNYNFRVYNLHYKKISEWEYPGNFINNLNKYPNNLFSIYIEKPNGIINTRGWFIKYKRYYYFLYINNIDINKDDKIIKQPLDKDHSQSEQFIFWKKLTKQKLKEYDNGAYWKLINDYNVNID